MFFHRILTIGALVVLAAVVFSGTETKAADWQRMSGEQLKVLFDNKTHKGSDFSIYYDGYGQRILRWEGVDYPADYYLRDDEYSYTSSGSMKSAEIWRDASADNAYRICQKGVCWEMQVFQGNPDNLK